MKNKNRPLPCRIKSIYIVALVVLCCSIRFAHAQQVKTVEGAVSDRETNEPLPGVTIVVKGTSIGTTTDFDGNFSIRPDQSKTTLVFSYIGYKSQEIIIYDDSMITVEMLPDATSLDEVVVVGYGTQKKINLTGAVDQVGSEAFKDRPMPNATRGLQGMIPNLNINIGDGKPTRTSSYNVRGATSIGAGGSALVLIDGVPGDPALLNPKDIESVSVLKDAASAAIYGARGSFGVVLITTKKSAKGKAQLNFSTSYSFHDRTIKPDLVTDGYTWAKLFDQAYYSWNDYKTHPSKANSVFPFSLEYLAELEKRQGNPNSDLVDIDPATGRYTYYGNTDWQDELYAKSILSREYAINASGGSEKVDYYVSGRLNSQDGIFHYNPDKYKIYNLRSRGSIQLTDWLRVENNLDYSEMNYFYPILNHPSDTPVWRRVSDEAFPVALLRNPDGTLTQNASIVFGSFISGGNYSDTRRQQIRNTMSFKADFLEGDLKVAGDYTFRRINELELRQYTPVPYSVKPGEALERGENKLSEEDNKTDYKGFNVYAEYQKNLGNHFIKALMGYNYENLYLKQRFTRRDGLINSQLPDFSLINGENITIRGGGQEWATSGGFFRLNYDFKQKYLLEVNGRYDGSSKFPQNQQWGFFPSVSAGWRVSQEGFWEGIKEAIPELKFRASYGTLGNGNISPYQYLGTMSVNQLGIIINGQNPLYTSKPGVVPDGLTWEKATTLNLGINLEMFKRKLTTSFDWYNRKTTDMFTISTPLPSVFGASEPKGNYADLETKGWELSIGWQDKIKFKEPLNYKFRFTLADNRSQITKFNNPEKTLDAYYEGMELGEMWGFVNDGYFIDQADIDNHADQSYIRVSAANIKLPGDIKFKDLNGDGIINIGSSTLDDPGDRKVIGNSRPRYLFGFNTDLDWGNFFFSAFFQGVGQRDFWPGTDASLFWGAYNRPYSWHPTKMENMMWSESNPDAYFPRLRGYVALNSRGELREQQSKYVQNAAYVRLKNLTIGYSLPKSFLANNGGLSSARVFLTGQNLWTYSPMFKVLKTFDPEVIDGSDPELAGNRGDGMRYPMLKTISVGLDITF